MDVGHSPHPFEKEKITLSTHWLGSYGLGGGGTRAILYPLESRNIPAAMRNPILTSWLTGL